MDDEVNSYLTTEFLFYLLPHYLVIPSFAFRYYKIMQEQPIYEIPTLPGQQVVTCLEEERHPRRQIQALPASYVIKTKLSLFNSYLYLLTIFISIVSKKDVFYASEHKAYCPLYFFGFIAWSFSAILLRREHQRNLGQSLWTHRIYWIYTATLSITKLFEDYFLPLNVILNAVYIPTNIILGIYAVYRAEDTDTIALLHNEDIPYFIKLFFENLQLNTWVRILFRIKDSSQFQNEEGEQDQQNIKQLLNNAQIDIEQIQRSFKPTAQTIKQQIGLLNTLPRRNIFVDRKLRYIKVNQKYKNFYFIISQVGNDRFEVQRQFKEFVKLQEQLTSIFNQKNFPKINLPRLNYSQEEQDDLNRTQTIEEWLQNLTKNPIFMVQQVLDFLKFSQEKSAPFLIYFEFAYKTFCSKIYHINYLKNQKKRESTIRGPSLIGYYEEERQTVKIADVIKTKMEFKVQIDEKIKQQKEFGFQITCIPQGRDKIKWKLTKNQQNIRSLNQRIEDQCRVTVPFYYRILAAVTDRESHHQDRSVAYRKYIQKLLESQKYYCPSLFQFIRFDPIQLETRVMGTKISLGDLTKPQRRSHYMEEFDDTGQFIEILRVDRLIQGSYKCHIKRKGLRIQKTTDQMKQLRENLIKLYRGVCNVPDLDLKQCHKEEVKVRCQNYLRAVQTLPKVKISKYFKNFYENSINEQ